MGGFLACAPSSPASRAALADGIKSYPNTSVRPQTPLSQLNSAGFWYNTSSAPVAGGDHWNWTSDLWSAGNQDEIMVFTSWSGGRQAAGEGR